jgi:ferredoxin
MRDETFTVTVDLDVCDSHGQCVFAAPGVFELDELGELQYEAHPPESARAGVENAVRLCPVNAIKIGN